MIHGESHPMRLPVLMAAMRTTSIVPDSTAPAQSNPGPLAGLRGALTREASRSRMAANVAMVASPAEIRKKERQPMASTTTPPMIGPAIPASPTVDVYAPMPLPRWFAGKTVAMMAYELVWMMPMPADWTIRAPMRNPNDGEIATAIAPPPNRNRPRM